MTLHDITFRNSEFSDNEGNIIGHVDSDGDFCPADGFEFLEGAERIEALRDQALSLVEGHGIDSDFEPALIEWVNA